LNIPRVNTPFRLTTLICSVLFSLTLNASTQSLKPEKIHIQTLQEIVSSLNQDHYNDIVLNDELSGKILDQYIKALDPSRAYFYATDIEAFEQFRNRLDDDIKNGDLSAPYEIFNTYQQRTIKRLQTLISKLQDSNHSFDFNIEESLESDRTETPWAKTEEQMNDFWRKRLKSALLSLKLADKDLDDATEVLLKRYKSQLSRAKQTNDEDVFQSYANAVTQQFDPHTQYFSPRRSENFNINMSLSLEGIGAVLQSENENTKIVRLVPAGPADKAGQLKPADLIVGVGQGIDGAIQDVIGWRLDEVVALIRGPKGTIVRLEIIPADGEDGHHKVIQIRRNRVKLEEQAAQSKIIELQHLDQDYKLGVITIPAFYIDFSALQRGDSNYKSTTRDVEKLITELQQQDINGLIIDLRDNGGGSLREANELIGLFISRGPTVQIRDPEGRVNIMGDSDPKIAYDGPMAVLVNRLSASASEIFAGAIQDYRRGIIIGGQTFGKGTVQTLSPLGHGQLKLTHAKFYRISGDSTQHKGVIPDVALPSLYDKEEIGESALDGALPWDQVHEIPHKRYLSFESILPEITTRNNQRSQFDPDFLYIKAQRERIENIKSDNLISLNEGKLQSERDAAQQWQLNTENTRRAAKQQAPIKALSDLEDELEKDSQGRTINPEAEAILAETGRVLLDLIELTDKYIAIKN